MRILLDLGLIRMEFLSAGMNGNSLQSAVQGREEPRA